jgi:hypothetical protein
MYRSSNQRGVMSAKPLQSTDHDINEKLTAAVSQVNTFTHQRLRGGQNDLVRTSEMDELYLFLFHPTTEHTNEQ